MRLSPSGTWRVTVKNTLGGLALTSQRFSGVLEVARAEYAPMKDIDGLRLPVELVVLSACRTGLGQEVRGEGLIGLTRGFMYAGAPRVVVSLWQIDDRASAEFMKRFYQAMLGQKLRPAAALRAAQISMQSDKRWHQPHYWAAFTLQGEWR